MEKRLKHHKIAIGSLATGTGGTLIALFAILMPMQKDIGLLKGQVALLVNNRVKLTSNTTPSTPITKGANYVYTHKKA